MTKKSDQSEDLHHGGLAWQEKGEIPASDFLHNH
jgi:hypothetical protein